eukprot:CAMPEP_0114364240 /NCGR_PEP_ID=MMETSP0101-20121206/27309_1 /TAXON_ID=38822 ORGANISM="Pteridomonas danica, Strain PT" /NCGR_SAMPLE_ID=MMETSP0101 /ASSEMBLY_ACC=CAM_ASM_000211 /LENGTH=456 /DNA_ID=CAMNT_0001511565 /DNA_START=11 /DNA_END=1381 /DNA_ORIENTATION=+
MSGWFSTFAGFAVVAIAILATLPKPQNEVPERCNHYLPIQTFPETVPILPEKMYDVVIYGATGFTGKLVANYLATKYDPAFKWAIAGRSESKLKALKKEFNPAFPVGIIIADSSDPKTLNELMTKTKVVITTVGPYTEYGTPLIEAAAKSGVHYCDLSGEPFWQREMIDKYDEIARHTGAKILLASGYDSIPFDLGGLYAYNEFERIHKEPASEISSLVTETRGWLSGGTFASAGVTFKQIAAGEVTMVAATDPYLLISNDDIGVVKACRRDGEVSGWGNRIRYDVDHSSIGMPHFMASINARIFRRTMALSGVRNVSYSEGLSLTAVADMTIFMLSQILMGKMPLADIFPSPGSGPSPSIMKEGKATIDFVAKNHGGDKKIKTRVKFIGDMGYNATSKMIAETGLCLASAICSTSGNYQGGGVITPGAAIGDGLIRRLEAADNGKFFSFTTISTN